PGDDQPAYVQSFLDGAQIGPRQIAVGRHIGAMDVLDQRFDLAGRPGIDPGNRADKRQQDEDRAEDLDANPDFQGRPRAVTSRAGNIKPLSSWGKPNAGADQGL